MEPTNFQQHVIDNYKPVAPRVFLGGAIGWGKTLVAKELIYRTIEANFEHAQLAANAERLVLVPPPNWQPMVDELVATGRYKKVGPARHTNSDSSVILAGVKGLLKLGTASDKLTPHAVHGTDLIAIWQDCSEVHIENLLPRLVSRFRHEAHGMLAIQIHSGSGSPAYEKDLRHSIDLDIPVYIVEPPLWATKPPGTYSGPTFRVETGTRYTKPRILNPTDTPYGPVIEVPVEFFNEFNSNVRSALRDIAGVYPPSPEVRW